MTSVEFSAALREAGFDVDHGRIVDVSGKCPGFATLPSFNKGVDGALLQARRRGRWWRGRSNENRLGASAC